MDRYDAARDHYCYPGTTLLKNRLNIRDPLILEQAERDITDQTIHQVTYQAPPYSLEYLQQIHRTLFSPLYDWAGCLREVSIAKGGTLFCVADRIRPEVQRLFKGLAAECWLAGLPQARLCNRLAEYYCEFNMIHPFREGNGRSQRIFFEHLALSAGYELDWSLITPEEWLLANLDGVNADYRRMEGLFGRILAPSPE